ncbi:MAG TPA: hypothetical protein VGL38_00275 [bacterium]|jgi:hypothetical protein
MKFSRALILSIIITLVLTLLLQFVFGAMAFGLFLFLPLSFFWVHNHNKRGPKPPGQNPTAGPPSTPIEPR